MEQELLKYLDNGIHIDGNPKDGYDVFTIITQHFKISSLDELTVERFENAISDLKKRDALEKKLMNEMEYNFVELDWVGYLAGKYDNK